MSGQRCISDDTGASGGCGRGPAEASRAASCAGGQLTAWRTCKDRDFEGKSIGIDVMMKLDLKV